ncbi:MAG: DUF1028 domain-containing protein [Castellaniella sp.]
MATSSSPKGAAIDYKGYRVTFSIAGFCKRTKAFGVAISSSSIAVASRCAWVSPLGAVVTQNITDPNLGVLGQRLLRHGKIPGSIIEELIRNTNRPEYRQIGVMDLHGGKAVHTGEQAFDGKAGKIGEDCLALGNLLSSTKVIDAMLDTFAERADECLEERLVSALQAGCARGGEIHDEHSAGLVVSRDMSWPVTNLRVDWSERPIDELRDIWNRFQKEQEQYVQWALDPTSGPQ